jgi:hypothetical protein
VGQAAKRLRIFPGDGLRRAALLRASPSRVACAHIQCEGFLFGRQPSQIDLLTGLNRKMPHVVDG